MYINVYNTEWSQTEGLYADLGEPIYPITAPQLISASAFNNTQSMAVINQCLMSAGDNNWGQLGNGTNTAAKFPEYVLNYLGNRTYNVRKVSCGYGFDLILSNDGRVWSVGCGDNGKLGIGETEHTNRVYPVKGKNGNGFLRNFIAEWIGKGYSYEFNEEEFNELIIFRFYTR